MSLNYICMYTNYLCCRPHFEVEGGPPCLVDCRLSLQSEWMAPPQPQHPCTPWFRCQQDVVPLLHSHPSILTLVGGISLLHPPAPWFQCQWRGISLLHPRTSTATLKTRGSYPHGFLCCTTCRNPYLYPQLTCTCGCGQVSMGFWWVTHTIDIIFYRHTCVYIIINI